MSSVDAILEGGTPETSPKSLLVILVTGLAVIGIALGALAVATSVSSSDSLLHQNQGSDIGTELNESELDVHEDTVVNGTIELGDVRTTISGTANDSLGETVVGVGNLSGGDANDVALGVPEAGNDTAGTVHLFFGPVEEGELNAIDANLTLTGESPGDWAGYDIASADLTSDGVQDLVIGAPGAGPANGSVYVFYGAELREYADNGRENVSLANASVTITGDEPGDRFGHSVTAHGNDSIADRDVETQHAAEVDNGDAFLAGGAPGAENMTGAVFVFHDFDPAAEQFETAADATASVTGEDVADQAGWSVAAVANYTEDGAPALAIGAPNRDTAGQSAGAVYVLTNVTSDRLADPADDGTVDLTDDGTLATANMTLEGQSAGDQAGWAVAAASDLNADDHNDLIIGAPFSNTSAYNAGSVYVHFAASHEEGVINITEVDRTMHGEAGDDLAGWSVAGSADLTCDHEHGAVLVGAPATWQSPDAEGGGNGTVYLVHGAILTDDPNDRSTTDDGPVNVSLADAQATFVGEVSSDRAGTSVAAPGDVTGNDAGDVLVGAPGHNESRGIAYVVEGDCPVVKEPVEEAFFEVEIVEKNDPVEAGETLEVTVEVTNTGDAAGTQDVRLKVDGERIDAATGITLEPNETETVTLTWETSPSDVGEHTVVVYSEDDRDKQQITVTEPPATEAFFAVEILEKNDPVEAGETLEVLAKITNTGDEAGEQRVYMKIDGERVASSTAIKLRTDETATVTLEWETDPSDVGDRMVTLYTKNDRADQEIRVTEPPEKDAFFDVEFSEKNDPIEAGETLEVAVKVTNSGDETGAQDIRLKIDGERVDVAEGLTLDPGETETVTLTWETGHSDVGDHWVKVYSEDDHAKQQVTVTEPPAREAFFELEFVEKNDPVVAGETLEVTVRVTNTGGQEVTQTIELLDFAEEVADSEEVTLGPDESTETTLFWDTSGWGVDVFGTIYVRSEDDLISQTIEIVGPDFTVINVDKQEAINTTEPLDVTVDVENIGSVAGTENVSLAIDGEQVDSQELTLDAGEVGTADLQWEGSAEPGAFEVTILIGETTFHIQTVTVVEPLVGEPVFQIDVCTEITEPGHYELVGDLQPEDTDTCLDIQSENVTIDGNGHAIDGSAHSDGTESIGVRSDATQGEPTAPEEVRLRDVPITGWGTGISITTDESIAIENAVIRDNEYGILLSPGSTPELTDVTLEGNDAYGAFSDMAGDLSISDSTIRANGEGVGVADGSSLELVSSTVEDNDGTGVTVSESSGVISGTTVTSNGGTGVAVAGIGYNSIVMDAVRLGDNEGKELAVQGIRDGGESSATDVAVGPDIALEFSEQDGFQIDRADRGALPALPTNASAAGAGLDVEEVSTADFDATLESTFEVDASDPDAAVELWRYDGTAWTPVDGEVSAADGSIEALLDEPGLYAPVATTAEPR